MIELPEVIHPVIWGLGGVIELFSCFGLQLKSKLQDLAFLILIRDTSLEYARVKLWKVVPTRCENCIKMAMYSLRTTRKIHRFNFLKMR